MNFITVGEVLKAQGLKGEIKVKALTDDELRFDKLKVVYIDKVPYKIIAKRYNQGFVYLLLDSVDDRNKAEVLAGKFLEIDRVNSVRLDEGQYLIIDLVGCKLLSENGEELGIINDIAGYGAADVITAKLGTKTFRFPFLDKIVKKIDIEKKEFVVFHKLFCEVCVHED